MSGQINLNTPAGDAILRVAAQEDVTSILRDHNERNTTQ